MALIARRLILAWTLTLYGCGGQPTVHVHGRVTLDGRPLPSGTVTFHPVTSGAPGYAEIQPDGAYRLATVEGGQLAAGAYRVTIVSRELPPAATAHEMPLPGPSRIPLRYAQAEQSELQFELLPGENAFDLPLVSQ